MKRFLLGLVGAFGLLSSIASAQPVTQNVITGNECWTAAQGPGGSASWLCIGAVRNGTDLLVMSGSGAQALTAGLNNSTIFWTGTAPTTLTITTPATPVHGQILTIATDTTLTTMVTLTPNTGQTLNASYTSQTLSAGTSVEFQYNLPTTKWFKMR